MGFCFISDSLGKWCELFKSILSVVMQNQNRRELLSVLKRKSLYSKEVDLDLKFRVLAQHQVKTSSSQSL